MFVYQMKRFCCLSILLLVSTTLGEEVDPYYVSGEVLVFKQILPEGYINSSLHKDEIDYSPHGPAFPFGINHLPSGPAPPSQDLPPTHRPKPGGNSPPSRPISPSTNDINHPPSDPNGPSPIPAVLFYPTPSGVISPPEDTSKHPPENVPDRPPSEATTNSPLQGCVIPVKDALLSPLTFHKNNIIYPNSTEGKMTILEHDTVKFACPGSNINEDTHQASILATCLRRNFYYNSKILNVDMLECTEPPKHSARYTSKTCAPGAEEIEIGFETEDFYFQLILICFDKKNQITLYSRHRITKTIGSYKPYVEWGYFRENNFYSLDVAVKNVFHDENQRQTINRLLGLPEDSRKYVKKDKLFYLEKGHLSPRQDFRYACQQNATFYFINAAPQWEIFNNGNWYEAEVAVRKLAVKKKRDLIIFTGTYGVATLDHEQTGRPTELYLYVNGTTKAVPIPRFFWKVVYEPMSKAGIALVGVNNPFLKTIGSEHKICNDISNQIEWLTWQTRNITAGYTYACSVSDFRTTVTYLPPIDVRYMLVH